MAAGLYQSVKEVEWSQFRTEYETKILSSLKPRSRVDAMGALAHFEKIVKPGKVGEHRHLHRDAQNGFIGTLGGW